MFLLAVILVVLGGGFYCWKLIEGRDKLQETIDEMEELNNISQKILGFFSYDEITDMYKTAGNFATLMEIFIHKVAQGFINQDAAKISCHLLPLIKMLGTWETVATVSTVTRTIDSFAHFIETSYNETFGRNLPTESAILSSSREIPTLIVRDTIDPDLVNIYRKYMTIFQTDYFLWELNQFYVLKKI